MPVAAGRLAALGEAHAQLPHELRHLFENDDVSVPFRARGDALCSPSTQDTARPAAGCANQPHVYP